MDIPYQIIRSSRRTIAIQIRSGQVLVRAPQRLSGRQIQAFVESKADWIRKNLARQDSIPAAPSFTQEELQQLIRQAKPQLAARAAFFAPLVGVSYNRITIRAQHTRWGSCSSKGNLNFNCVLMLLPAPVQDYVVVHELCHRKELNHSPRFWALVEQVLPDYRVRRQWLKEHGSALIRRIPK